MDKTYRQMVNTLILAVGFLVIWQILFHVAGEHALSAPTETIEYIVELLGTSDFWGHMLETGYAMLTALVLASMIGLFVGFLLGIHRFSGEVAEPILLALSSIPKITLYPLILLALGLGFPAKVAFGTMHGMVPIAIYTMNAVRNIRPVLLKTGRVFRLTPWQMVRKVLFPAALPEVFTGLRVGFSFVVKGTLLGEMFGSHKGLGYLLMNAMGLHKVTMIMAIAFLVTVVAMVVSTILIFFDNRIQSRFK